ncbi:MAG: amidohydrolase family protein [bacterium]|jgi:aminocarboxymuconate-semialdehyde decarboxylase|nr:amidohydrolase family protein [bacterium]
MNHQEMIDTFCHWLPLDYFSRVKKITAAPTHMLDRSRSIPVMVDVEKRFALMDQFPGYRQILSLVSPPIEYLADSNQASELAEIANDSLAEIVTKYPDRFVGFVASLPMNNPSVSLKEAERAIKELDACGIQIFSNVNGEPIDQPEYLPLYHMMAKFDLPIWLHPARGMNHADYLTEPFSKYEIWWALGWLYETSVAMIRLIFAGIFDKFPKLKIVAHHAGAFIPVAEGRLGPGLDSLGSRTPGDLKSLIQTELKERPIDALKRFYTDTATFGSKKAIKCALEFYGIDKVMFATDMPFGPDNGSGQIRNTIKAIDELSLEVEEKRNIFYENLRKLIK